MTKRTTTIQGTTTNELFTKARARAGFSQKELARKVGYANSQVISNWERGVLGVPETRVERLCKALGVSPKTAYEAMVKDFATRIKTTAFKQSKF